MPKNKYISMVVLAAGLATSLTACGGGGETDQGHSTDNRWAGTSSAVFVVGAHANAPRPSLERDLNGVVDAVGAHEGTIQFVVNDGSPALAGDVLLPGSTPCKGNGCDTVRAQDRRAAKKAYDALKAEQTENNLLEAIGAAARAAGTGSLMVICDSGLQTAGELDFRKPGMLTADPAEVAQYLVEGGKLPDLTGWSVALGCLGMVAEPQEPLPTQAQRDLEAIWIAILTATGAEVERLPVAPSGEIPTGLPTVSTVPIPEVTPMPVPETEPNEGGPGITRHVLDEATLRFVPDQAVLTDPDSVREVLRPFAAWMAEDDKRRIRLVGTTSSWGTESGRIALSTARAETVRELLVELGVPRAHMKVMGVGTHWPGFVEDRDADGRLLPAAASRNRNVIVIPRG